MSYDDYTSFMTYKVKLPPINVIGVTTILKQLYLHETLIKCMHLDELCYGVIYLLQCYEMSTCTVGNISQTLPYIQC